MKLTWKRFVLFGALILALATAGVYLLRDYGLTRNPFNRRSGEIPQQNTAPALSVQIAPGSDASNAASRSQLADLQLDEAVAQLEDWLKLTPGNVGSINHDFVRALMQSLHNNPQGNAAFYVRIRQLLGDPNIDSARKQELIAALDRAASPVAVQLLSELSRQNLPAELKQSVLIALSNVGDYYWDKASFAEAVPILTELWSQSEDPELLRSVASALGKVGDAASINILMETALSGAGSIADIERSGDPRISAAWSALKNLHNDDVIPILQTILESDANNLRTSISANLLAGMGSIESTQALISWAQGAGDGYAPIAREAFSRIGTYDSLQYLNSVLAQNPSFKSKQVQTAIMSVLKR